MKTNGMKKPRSALGGSNLHKDCIGSVSSLLSSLLPSQMTAEILSEK